MTSDVRLDQLAGRLTAAPTRRVRVVGRDGSLTTRTFADLHRDVIDRRDELAAAGLGEGDLVGIVGRNCYEWIVADLALLSLRCVSVAVPVEVGPGPVDVGAAMARYGLCAALVLTPADTVAPLPEGAATLDARPLALRRRPVEAPDPPLPDGVFTIAFSSGTSGTPKGLMMSRAGIERTIGLSGAAWRVRPDDTMLIVMPFSTFQQRYLTYLAIWFGFDVAVVPPERLFQKLREVEPTIIVGPPSFFEIVESRVATASGRARLRHRAAAALHALWPGEATHGVRAWLGRPWGAMYGGRVRLMLTGSAPVGATMVRVFQQLGLPLHEVYGSTEVGWISFNLPGASRIGTAGRPVEGIEVVLGDGDEILVRSPAPQALGYRFEGEDTAASFFLPDGWIATGDVGRLVGGGHLKLVGRKRNTIITRSGVKVNPERLERELSAHDAVDRAMVLLNEQGSALRAVVWVTDRDDAGAVRRVEEHVDALNAGREPAQRIQRLVVRPASEVTVEAGLLTRNHKLDRQAVTRHLDALDERVGS